MVSALGSALRQLSGPVLLTGHTGFKGAWLTFLLEHLEIPVIGYSLPPQRGSLYQRTNRKGAIPEAFSDIRDLKSLQEFMNQYQPSAIIHMAAQPLVLESYRTPVETFETNVIGTANVLSVAFELETVQTIGVVTTDKVYRNDNSGRAFVETDALAGKDPYSASKVGTEAVVAAWQQIAKISGGADVISLRSGNVIGGGDFAEDRLLPDLIKAFTNGEEIALRNPKSTRPWQHVLDPLIGYLLAVEHSLNGNWFTAFNFGPDSKSLQAQQVAEIASRAWPLPTKIKAQEELINMEREALVLNLDSRKAHEVLDWAPRWSQENAVISTVRWWDAVLNQGISPIKACENDINFALKNI